MNEAFFIFIGISFGIIVSFFFLSRKKSEVDQTQNDSIKDLERRLTDLMISQMKEIRDSQNGASKILNDQVRLFTKDTTEIRENLKQIQEKVRDVSTFQEIFKSPKLKGQWGEASLEHILAQHFPSELWEKQHIFLSGDRVDAILKLPNGKILPIDSKFSSDNFERMINSVSEEDKDIYQKDFLRDIKKRIEEVASKYILPSEGTTDVALMYIPAEAIYYQIMFDFQKEDIASYAWKKKVVLISPNTIYLTLRTIEHWFRDTQVSKQTQEILKRLSRISQDARKLGDTFKKLGTHLKNSVSAYDNSEKRLMLFSDRVEKLLDTKEEKKEIKGPE